MPQERGLQDTQRGASETSLFFDEINVFGYSFIREANIRVLFPAKTCPNVRIEQRCMDSTCNVHLAITAHTLAGILGRN